MAETGKMKEARSARTIRCRKAQKPQEQILRLSVLRPLREAKIGRLAFN